jgi:hypothetical protein
MALLEWKKKERTSYEEARTIALQTTREEPQGVYHVTQCNKHFTNFEQTLLHSTLASGQHFNMDQMTQVHLSSNCGSRPVGTECQSWIATPFPSAYTLSGLGGWEVGHSTVV